MTLSSPVITPRRPRWGSYLLPNNKISPSTLRSFGRQRETATAGGLWKPSDRICLARPPNSQWLNTSREGGAGPGSQAQPDFLHIKYHQLKDLTTVQLGGWGGGGVCEHAHRCRMYLVFKKCWKVWGRRKITHFKWRKYDRSLPLRTCKVFVPNPFPWGMLFRALKAVCSMNHTLKKWKGECSSISASKCPRRSSLSPKSSALPLPRLIATQRWTRVPRQEDPQGNSSKRKEINKTSWSTCLTSGTCWMLARSSSTRPNLCPQWGEMIITPWEAAELATGPGTMHRASQLILETTWSCR